jgi:hypothetical protein
MKVRSSPAAAASSSVLVLALAVGCTVPTQSARPTAKVHGQSGVALVLDDTRHFRIEDLATNAILHAVSVAGIPGGPSMITTNPSGGWVVTYTPDESPAWNGASARLAAVDVSGNAVTFGPTYSANTAVSGLAVSPDGTRVAIALFPDTGATKASIVVMPMPGHRGTTRSWPVADPVVNEMMSLSWAPDGQRLTYIAGVQTGGGIGGNPVTLDTTKAGSAPADSAWVSANGKCDPNGAAWLGSTGRFAVVRDCPPNGTFAEVDAATGAVTGVTALLPHYACLAAAIHPSSDGSKILISRCGQVDLVQDGMVTQLDSQIVDAAWAG